jgi:hypothetical protein
MSAELSIVLLNVVIIVIAYLWVYPKLAGKSFNKVGFYDCFASGLALVIVGSKYWGIDAQFNFLSIQLNWFWFTLLSYSVIEIPIALWYFRDTLVKKD